MASASAAYALVAAPQGEVALALPLGPASASGFRICREILAFGGCCAAAGYVAGATCAKRRRVATEDDVQQLRAQLAVVQQSTDVSSLRFQETEKQVGRMQEQLGNMQSRGEQISEQVLQVQGKLGDANSRIDGLQRQTEQSEQCIHRMQEQLDDVGGRFDGLQDGLRNQGERSDAQVHRVQAQLSAAHSRLERLQMQTDETSAHSLQMQDQFGEARGRLDGLEDRSRQLQTQVDRQGIEVRQLAAFFGHRVSCALRDYANDVISRVNRALRSRFLGFGPDVATIDEPVVPALDFQAAIEQAY